MPAFRNTYYEDSHSFCLDLNYADNLLHVYPVFENNNTPA
jgi:hypothetical protein